MTQDHLPAAGKKVGQPAMNREQIIKLAREAGIEWQTLTNPSGMSKEFTRGSRPIDELERFAALVTLYAAPPKRKPLRYEQIERIYIAQNKNGDGNLLSFVKEIERAHGIVGQP